MLEYVQGAGGTVESGSTYRFSGVHVCKTRSQIYLQDGDMAPTFTMTFHVEKKVVSNNYLPETKFTVLQDVSPHALHTAVVVTRL